MICDLLNLKQLNQNGGVKSSRLVKLLSERGWLVKNLGGDEIELHSFQVLRHAYEKQNESN